MYNLSYKAFGNKAILIEWPQLISEEILYDILSFKNKIEDLYNNVLDISTAYNSLTIYLKKEILDIEKEKFKLNQIYILGFKDTDIKNFVWYIPVCYNKAVAPDLVDFLKQKNLELQQLIKYHIKNLYTVYFLGFLPGFPYLGGLPKVLHIPRKKTPHIKVEKGSVGIGGQQTGIYTMDSPGGWYIIGKTPISFFDANLKEPCFLKAGDKIKFESISYKQYLNLSNQVERGLFKLKKEVLNA